ncbi:ABC transporter ATP-binding protein [Fodinicola feengrottensis]|uniref:ABC transporter ATP-binding protein n=2 Tax=Fodinicola feengrottensis TaxID=435914 RepID=A0ABP4SA51_9ACTN
MFLALGGAVTAAGLAAVMPLITKHVVDTVVADHGLAQPSIVGWVLLMLVLSAGRFGGAFLRRYHAGWLSLNVQYDLRNDLLGALQRLDGTRQGQLNTGQVVSRSISDVTLVQGLLAFMPMIIGNLLMFVISLVAMLWLSPVLTLIALAIAPVLWIIAYRSRRDLFPANWAAQHEEGEVAGVVEAAITGVRVVKGFGQEERELNRLAGQARQLFGARMRSVRLTARYAPALQAVPAIGQVAALALGGVLALHHQVTLGTFLAFTTYLGQFVGPVRSFATLLTIGQQARASIERVMEVIDTRPTLTEAPDAVALPDGPLSIELEDVRFGYDDDRPVLDGVSLTVRPGETLALVGTAGSGKSTIAQLLPRFYDVQEGAIRVGGLDVRATTTDSLRRAMAIAFEDSFLFSDSVRANIAYGRPDATEAEVIAAARTAQADGFISELPDGYDTVVGEQGLTLSGGQRQRVALARALLCRSRILVLDDATSAIDATIEGEIHFALRPELAERTTLLIAHRRSSLALADRIAVLDAGKLVDIGTEQELDARCPLFVELLSGLEAGQDSSAQGEKAAPEADGRRLAVVGTNDKPSKAPVRESLFADGPLDRKTADRLAAMPTDTDPAVNEPAARLPEPDFSLRRLLKPLRWPLLAGLALVLADAVANLLVPALVRTGVDDGVTRQSLSVLLVSAAAALVIVLVDWVISTGEQLITGRTGERLLYTLRIKTFAHLQRLGLDYYERELSGRILTRMTTDVDALSTFLQSGLATVLVSVLTLGGVLVAMLALDAELTFVLAAALPILALTTVWFRRKSVPAYTLAREKVSGVNAAFAEDIAGLQVSQAYRREAHDMATFQSRGDEYRQVRARTQRYISIYFPFVEFLSGAATALILWVGASQVHSGLLTAGVLIAFLLYVDLFFSPVQQLSQVFDSYQQAAVGVRRLSDLLRTPTSTPQAQDPRPVPQLTGEIVLEDVHFAYNGAETEALSGVSLRIAPGETVALVGETGAGKSTAMKLVARFYDPTAGAVRVDGVDLRELDMAGYRQRLGLVPQEPYLFGSTVGEAIAYGRPDATAEAIAQAARAVGAARMIASLAGGYDHPVGERGRGLSAGQRQLIALARAELVNPDILLLDEATAALDVASEAAVNRATDALTRRRTTLVVAHRLTTASRADRIIVLDGGRIVEEGTHDQLLDLDGRYAQLWDAFTGMYDKRSA